MGISAIRNGSNEQMGLVNPMPQGFAGIGLVILML